MIHSVPKMPQRRGKGSKAAIVARENGHVDGTAILAVADSTQGIEKYTDHNSNPTNGIFNGSLNGKKDIRRSGGSNALSVRSTSGKRRSSEESNSNGRLLMRQWLEDQANGGTMPGLQWLDRHRKYVRINWKHASKSGWSKEDCEVFISWAKHTGISALTSNSGFNLNFMNVICCMLYSEMAENFCLQVILS